MPNDIPLKHIFRPTETSSPLSANECALQAAISTYLGSTTEEVLPVGTVIEITPQRVLSTASSKSFRNWFTRVPTEPSTTTKSQSIAFDHSLIKTGKNQWNLIENDQVGSGGFGTVYPSLWKIIIEDKQARLIPTDDVVKIQTFTAKKATEIQNLTNEYQGLLENTLDVKRPVITKDKAFLVMPNCGESLDKCMPDRRVKFNFDQSFAMAYGILNDMLALKRSGRIHRDLKPANICRRKVGDHYQYIFIDFGLSLTEEKAKSPTEKLAGTLNYIAPEFLENRPASYASEIYALAGILIQIFGGDALRLKKSKSDYRNTIKTPYSLDGLFGEKLPDHQRTIPDDVDKQLLDDIKQMLTSMFSEDPSKRPSIEDLFRFFSAIPYRREWIKDYLALYNEIQSLSVALNISYYNTSDYQPPSHSKRVKALPALESLTTLFSEHLPITKLQNAIQTLKTLKTEKEKLTEKESLLMARLQSLSSKLGISHALNKSSFTITNALVAQYIAKKDVGTVFDTSNLGSLEVTVIALGNIETLQRLVAEHLMSKFANTNSTGIIQIQRVLNDSNKKPWEQLLAIQAISEKKIQPGLSYQYSHSHFFGKGRQKEAEELYEILASIPAQPLSETGLKRLQTINEKLATVFALDENTVAPAI